MDDVAGLTAALRGRYSIEHEIGRGGMAVVYRARDERHLRTVAVKVLRPEVQATLSVQRFLSEIRVTANLQHPNLLPLFDSGDVDGVPYYVMPFVEGESLRARLQRDRQLPLDAAIRIVATAADALDYAHRRGVVHRDLKPENILMEEGQPVIADFGIALAVTIAGGERLTQGGGLGTPNYMSPEAMGEGNVTGQSDVYSLAVVLYEMLAGRLPWRGSTPQDVIANRFIDGPQSLRSIQRSVPAGVEAVIMRALATKPEDRFESAQAFANALRAAAPSLASSPTARSWAIGGTVVAAAVAVFWTVTAGRPSSGAAEADIVRLTTSGDAQDPSLSPNGQQLAYTTIECSAESRCSVNLVVKDIDGAGTATLARGLYAVNGTEWSHDGRYILVNTTTADGKWGVFVTPSRGGEMRFLGCCQGWFIPGTDTVLLNAHRVGVDSVAHVQKVLVRDGRVVHAMAVRRPAAPLYVEPFVAGMLLVYSWNAPEQRNLVTVTDGQGRALDSLELSVSRRAAARAWPAGNAILVTVRREDRPGVLVIAHRVMASGRIAERGDTLLQQLDVPRIVPTATGGLVYSAGTTTFEISTLERANGLTTAGKEARVATSTGRLLGSIDPTGRLIAVVREINPGAALRQLSVKPFEGGSERELIASADLTGWAWESDGESLLVLVSRGPDSTEIRRVQVNGRSMPLRIVPRAGWIWAPATGGYWVLNALADTIRIYDVPHRSDTLVTRPASWMMWHTGSPSPDGQHFAFTTWDKGQDSLVMLRISLRDGGVRRLAAFSGQVNAGASWLTDDAIIAQVQEAGTNALYRVASDGSGWTRLGLLPRKRATVSLSTDGLRAIQNTFDTREDIYLIRNFSKLREKR